MGWQDRDWAKFTEDELNAIYGASVQRTISRDRHVMRIVVWSLAGLAASGALFATRHTSRPAPFPRPAVFYGVAARDDSGWGHPIACTEEELVGDAWRCDAWSIDTTNAPIVGPTPYVGTCTHARVDQELGRWVCLEDVPGPAPGGENA
jgi:hypothetical protein